MLRHCYWLLPSADVLPSYFTALTAHNTVISCNFCRFWLHLLTYGCGNRAELCFDLLRETDEWRTWLKRLQYVPSQFKGRDVNDALFGPNKDFDVERE